MARTYTRRTLIRAGLTALPAWVLGGPHARQQAASLPFKLGVISDEISMDFEQVASFLQSYSLHYCDLRELWNKNIMYLSREELTRARDILRRHDIRVSSIASPLFKYDLPEMPGVVTERDLFGAAFTERDTDRLLKQVADLAHFFDAKLIRVFSYWRVAHPEKAYPFVRDRIAKAAETAGRYGIVLAIENEHTCNVATSPELGRIVKDINSPHLTGNWDPANTVVLGEVPFPDGYRAVRGLFKHMHVKDLRLDPHTRKPKWLPVGAGVIDFRGLFKALWEDHYQGTMALETHYRRPDGNAMESTRESLEGLLKLLPEG